ncbi:XdhC family protein [Tsuneonella amylolytica]|uniref:XdhC family protein n=1 Tax=Tsuneonella amylolytica TaxID=2338327 RepID=UPI000EA9AF3F|nr:XdhC family protein [Tsuneonella amylolytica]
MVVDEDHAALAAAAAGGAALCTIVGIEGSFSRRVGAQLAVSPGGEVVGSLSDGCLEEQVARDCLECAGPEVRRYGRGSPLIDFRLPCGGGLDILLDPSPDRAACEQAMDALADRRLAALPLPAVAGERAARSYIPRLKIRAFGEGPELASLAKVADAAGLAIEAHDKGDLVLGQPAGREPADMWTAVVLLFHDHEWELALLEEALASDAFYIGAQGGRQARDARLVELAARGASGEALARIRSPIGVPAGSRTPQTLALSALAEITHAYERLRPDF